MIGTLPPNAFPSLSSSAHAGSGKVLRMRTDDDDRINGSYPVWEDSSSAQDGVQARLSSAAESAGAAARPPGGAMAYAETAASRTPPEAFGFGDLLDMINPLQHIPVVSEIYRGMTGDTIKPISNIMGGVIYGGFVGAALSVADTVVQYETGKNAAGNVVALLTEGKGPTFRSHATTGTPEQRLNQAAREIAQNSAGLADLPGTTLSFADMRAMPMPQNIEPAAGPAQKRVIQPHYND
jgi:hypothetical protein